MADNESAASSGTATVKPEPSNPPETKRWADVAEEAEAEQESEASSTDVKLDSLAIDESKQGHSTLTDPDDSSIEAVTSGDTPYTSAKRFEDLNLVPELFKRLLSSLKGLPIEAVLSGDTPYASAKRFEDLNLVPELLKHLLSSLKGLPIEIKLEKPSKIQAISLPVILTPPQSTQEFNSSGSQWVWEDHLFCAWYVVEPRRSKSPGPSGSLCLPHKRVSHSEYGSASEDGEVHWDNLRIRHTSRSCKLHSYSKEATYYSTSNHWHTWYNM